MIALGIDPGTSDSNPCGLSLIRWPRGADHPALLFARTISPPRGVAGADATIRRVALFLEELTPVMPRPDCVGVECAHVGKNAQSALRLAEVVGVVMSWAARHGVTLYRCQPTQAKQALTGDGSADKKAMIAAVKAQFGERLPKDAADATGVAVWAIAEHRVIKLRGAA